jgi:hypothetical protein
MGASDEGPKGCCAKGFDAPVTHAKHGVDIAGVERYHSSHPNREFDSLITIAAPAHDGAVAFERNRKIESGGDLGDIGEITRDADLPIGIAAPCHYRAIAFEG